MQCADCKEIIKRKTPQQIRCLSCSLKKGKSSKEKKQIEYELECLQCKDIFKTESKLKKFCSVSCRKINFTLKSNDNWVKAMPKEKDIFANGRLEYSRVSKRPTGWMKKFKACRG
jgi:hypothetical protein